MFSQLGCTVVSDCTVPIHYTGLPAWLHSGNWLHCAHTLYWSPIVAAQWNLTALCPCILMFSQRGSTVVSDYTVPIHYTGLPEWLHSGMWLHRGGPFMQLFSQIGCTVETDYTVPTHANGLPAWLHSGNWLHCVLSIQSVNQLSCTVGSDHTVPHPWKRSPNVGTPQW